MSPASMGAAQNRSRRNLALLVAGTFFMENLDGTILTTAVPSIGRSLHVPAVSVGVTITAYLLTLAVLIPLSGWSTLRFGARRVFLGAIAVFTLSSLLCAGSTDLVQLVGARVLQGAGGAMMVPVGRLVVLRDTGKGDLVRVVALFTWPALAAPVIAPLLGGVLTTTLGWPWIFLVNAPLGVLAFAAAWRLVPAGRGAPPPPLDRAGFVLLCTGLGALVALSSLLAEPEIPVLLAVGLAVAGTVLALLAVRHFRHTPHPLLSLDSLYIESFRVAHLGGSAFRLATNAVPFVLPLLFQVGFGWTPVLSGALVLLVFAGNLLIKPATTPMLRRWGFRRVILLSAVAAMVSMLLNACLAASTPIPVIAAVLLFGGIARSVGFTAYNTVGFADITSERLTAANTLAATVQQVSAGVGVALGAVALRAGTAVGEVVGGDPLLPYRCAFGGIAIVLLLAVVEVLRVPPGLGERIRPPRRGRPAPGAT